jgi:branched-subunit amino acid aminotransferase/4-amino-4-deoxychorismate lyase
VNGRIVSRAEAAVSAFDRGFLYGDGFFETTRVWSSVPVFLDRHLDRLCASCAGTGFGAPLDVEAIRNAVARLVESNAVTDGYLRVTVSRGVHSGRLDELAAANPTVTVEVRAMQLPPLEAAPPLILMRSPYRRDEHSPLVRHKSLSYQTNVLALAAAHRAGADEVFFLNCAGNLTEGAVSNLFFVSRGRVFTPDVSCGLLPGIARQVVLELCGALGIPAQVGVFREGDLREAEAAFCTNSLRGVMPVRGFVDRPERAVQVHEVTARLQAEYAGAVRLACGTGNA